nr:chorismate mutase [Nakamurella deserti]
MLSTRVRKADMTEDRMQLPHVAVPQSEDEIAALRLEIDSIDAELVRLIKQRTAISHAIGAARMKLGGPRVVHSREMKILDRFRDLGQPGVDLALMLLDLGRGKLGRSRSS